MAHEPHVALMLPSLFSILTLPALGPEQQICPPSSTVTITHTFSRIIFWGAVLCERVRLALLNTTASSERYF